MQRSAIAIIRRLSVRLSSVTRVYCDKGAEASVTHFSLKSSSTHWEFDGSFTMKFEEIPRAGESYGGVVTKYIFDFKMLYLWNGAS